MLKVLSHWLILIVVFIAYMIGGYIDSMAY